MSCSIKSTEYQLPTAKHDAKDCNEDLFMNTFFRSAKHVADCHKGKSANTCQHTLEAVMGIL